jgi:hypothetical protein
VPFKIEWRLWDVAYGARHLTRWSKDGNKELVRARGAATLSGSLPDLLAAELRDWVSRGGERYSPVPDRVLDTYWKASRETRTALSVPGQGI